MAIVLLLLGTVPAAATHELDGQRHQLQGTQVGLFDTSDLETSADAAFFIRHGWTFLDVRRDNAREAARRLAVYMDDDAYRFELSMSVNGGAELNVALTRTIVRPFTCHAPGGDQPCWLKQFHVEFAGGTFAPGQEVVFTGRWYGWFSNDDILAACPGPACQGPLALTLSRKLIFK
jgi:hypothetical protein